MTDFTPLARIDSFAYRHRLAEVMTTPVLTGTRAMSLGEACDRMYAIKASSLVVVDDDGRALGIVTERDLLRVLSAQRGAGLEMAVGDVMSTPVHAVPSDAYLFVALGRMTRLGVRHLVVTDRNGRPLGMITGRAMLKVRVSEALVLGDDIAEATGSEDMDRVRRSLPKLARDLLGEGVSARHVCAVVSNVLRDMTARATELAEQSLINDGWGEAPARWSMLVLGSAGRGESLLVFDQDHAIVHTGGEAEDAWFAELGKRVADTLNAAGIPYCEGKVMSSTPQWRRSLENWRREISDWVLTPGEQTVMNTDIFFDLQPVHGDAALAEELRGIAIGIAQTSSFFLQFLGMHVARMDVPIGIFGEFVTTHGRLNAKKYGLLPLVSAARARAIRAGIHVTNTYDRYAALCESGLMHPDDLISLGDVHELMLKVMLEQQLADLAAGIAPSARIEPRRLDRGMQSRLKAAFKRIRTLKSLIGINA